MIWICPSLVNIYGLYIGMVDKTNEKLLQLRTSGHVINAIDKHLCMHLCMDPYGLAGISLFQQWTLLFKYINLYKPADD